MKRSKFWFPIMTLVLSAIILTCTLTSGAASDWIVESNSPTADNTPNEEISPALPPEEMEENTQASATATGTDNRLINLSYVAYTTVDHFNGIQYADITYDLIDASPFGYKNCCDMKPRRLSFLEPTVNSFRVSSNTKFEDPSSDDYEPVNSGSYLFEYMFIGNTKSWNITVSSVWQTGYQLIYNGALQSANSGLAFMQIRAGDVNGDRLVDASDTLLVLQQAAGKITLTKRQNIAADVNKDDSIDGSDSLLISQYAVSKILTFWTPFTTPTSSNPNIVSYTSTNNREYYLESSALSDSHLSADSNYTTVSLQSDTAQSLLQRRFRFQYIAAGLYKITLSDDPGKALALSSNGKTLTFKIYTQDDLSCKWYVSGSGSSFVLISHKRAEHHTVLRGNFSP